MDNQEAMNRPIWLFPDAFQSATPFQGIDQGRAKATRGPAQTLTVKFEVFLAYSTRSPLHLSVLFIHFPLPLRSAHTLNVLIRPALLVSISPSICSQLTIL